MDVNLGIEEMVTEPLEDWLRYQMGIGDAATHHLWLSAQTLMVNGREDVATVCSEMQSERERLYHTIAITLSREVESLGNPPDESEVGIVTLTVRHADADIDNDWWQNRRDIMLLGLRHILAAWSAHRSRTCVICTHAGQIDDDGNRMDDHIHVLYQKGPYDSTNQLCSEIRAYVEDGCSWETIDQSLGIFGAAEMPAFDDEYDEGEYDTADDDIDLPDDFDDEDDYPDDEIDETELERSQLEDVDPYGSEN